MEFLLEGWGKVCGHLPDGVTGSVADSGMLAERHTAGKSSTNMTRDRERQRQRQRERETEREKLRDRDRERERDTKREIETERKTQR